MPSYILPDNTSKTTISPLTGLELAAEINKNLALSVLAVEVDGVLWDVTRPITRDAHVRLLTWEDDEGKNIFWHSSAHLMAEALVALYPKVQLGTGPAIENGFYYDVDLGGETIDLPKIEAKMLELSHKKSVFTRKNINRSDAIEYFSGNPYKQELLGDLEEGEVTLYCHGEFTDLCCGPHLPHTGLIKAVKLLNVAGTYWRGDADRPQLTRIYGVSFPNQKLLIAYFKQLEEAKKRNHQKLGKELGLFTFSRRVGLGLPLWLPKGTILRDCLEQFLRLAQKKAGYQPVVTPHIGHKNLYETSGHFSKYAEDSFRPIESPQKDEVFMLKPMNCPHHCEIYLSSPKSYRDLPLRLAEFGTVYRYEQHGELNGLIRTRGFTQDDAHIFCRSDQIKPEFESVIDLVLYALESLGFSEYTAQVSLRDPKTPDKYIGEVQDWDLAEQVITEVAISKGLQVVQCPGEAAFYGPKLDFMVKDALGRRWQLGTVQLDYQLPKRFDLTYTGADNCQHRPVMIHRAPLGSLERFIAILIEHTGGNFPFWLSPEQVAVLSISGKFNEYAKKVHDLLINKGLRSMLDDRDEKIGKKIREASLQKVPYLMIIGEKEVDSSTVSVRERGGGDLGIHDLTEFIKGLVKKNMFSSQEESQSCM